MSPDNTLDLGGAPVTIVALEWILATASREGEVHVVGVEKATVSRAMELGAYLMGLYEAGKRDAERRDAQNSTP